MDKNKLMEDVERSLFYSRHGSFGVGMNELEKCRAAMCKLFMPDFDSGGIAAFKSFTDAYIHFSGDRDITGLFKPMNVSEGLRSCMDFTASSFGYALQNALSMYLSKTYKEFPYREEIFVSEKKKAKDFRKIHAVQLGYFGDLPDIDPEAEDYGSIEQYEDTETQYNLSQKGAILWATRKHIVNDSIDVIKGMVKRMARAARKTHARYVWSFYIDNETCPDGTNWFTVGHSNLGSNALDYSPIVTAITALANMTEPGPSAEKLSLDLASFNWHLVVPIDLWDLAVKKNQGDSYYTGNDLTTKVPNPCYKLFGDRNERIVVCPFTTDTNDWGVIRDKEDVPVVEMSYLNGQEDPEFILEEGPTQGHVFKADRLGYKIRHEYGGTLADYRGGYKSVV
jgi:hypothetical protein